MTKSFPQLLVLYETGQLTGSELDQFFQLLELEENQALLAAAIDEKAMDVSNLPVENSLLTERSVAALRAAIQPPVRSYINRLPYWGWAAAAVLVIATGWWLLNNTRSKPATDQVATTTTSNIQAPQTNRAQITLANGQHIYLDSTANGVLLNQGAAQLVKTADGAIRYAQQKGTARELVYNTLFNPRGSRINHMELTDGSQVWLNAGSSLTYPVTFTGNERKVTINGEAYFEIAHNPNKPFIVSKGNTTVQVLGTHFNVNAYDDENSLRVTLLEGKVEVSSAIVPASKREQSAILKPGEQAIVVADPLTTDHSPLTVNHSPDLEQTMAWKNGRFVFGDKVDVATIMRQVARWYDLEVELQSNFNQHFGGSISREASAAEVFKVLEATGGLRCKVTGRKVIVTQGP